ncbi:MAG: Tol-Pal system beta propeller repeat protein TolB [Gammaproteobacteria bacterium]
MTLLSLSIVRYTRIAALACLLVAGLAPAHAAEGELTIKIDQGTQSALPIAIVPFAGEGGPTDIAAVVRSDLARSGQFNPMPPEDMPSKPSAFGDINFKDWRVVGMENLVVGKVAASGDGGYVVEFRVVDVFKGTQLLGFRIPTEAANMRLTAHHIADLIYETLLHRKGAFATRIAYVTVERRSAKDATYRLQVADADGYDPHTILESRQPLMSPSWAPDGGRLAYVSFEDRNSAIYVQDIRTGGRQKLVSGPGINSAPSFSPDGARLVVTLSRDGNPELYTYSFASRQLTRLTYHASIDTEGVYSPDGRWIYFTSDRGGGPQIYKMSSDGGDPQRVTFNMGNYNSRARISPDGKKVALVHGGKGYRIGILDLGSNSFDLLTNASLDESPSFAPNGDMIIYATMGGRGTELAATSTDGRLRQRLAVQRGEVREPAWGPFRNQ